MIEQQKPEAESIDGKLIAILQLLLELGRLHLDPLHLTVASRKIGARSVLDHGKEVQIAPRTELSLGSGADEPQAEEVVIKVPEGGVEDREDGASFAFVQIIESVEVPPGLVSEAVGLFERHAIAIALFPNQSRAEQRLDSFVKGGRADSRLADKVLPGSALRSHLKEGVE